ncbi:acyl transferase domain-containing protein [Flavobacterium sp. 90]|uniref:type I polyketide synthase n=2 Tax=unclassified Flavobacterium TaxID=196869 RepID=UPI001049A623|nr:type I polyketide synthase [Flavobacterium sp. 90]TCK55871.1 acyl transferase domain-containing protein [Flavobacterium sp. 90]
MKQISENDIAIIGMAGRFPNAKNIDEYWQNLVSGVNSIVKVDEEELLASGFSESMLNHKRFVNASSRLEDAKYFDADFFGLSNIEATHMDPQIRLLLQTSWHAIEDAGYDMSRLDVAVGNFCGMSTNSYLLKVLDTNSYTEHADPLLYRILNEKDFLATWISYKLNLTGPAMSVQTACSTSLLAVHLACQSLLNRECDMALAGGVSFDSNENIGYIHTPGSIYSKDGVCRPFDSAASGTVNGDGVGSIVLKRATDAIKDKDYVYALIKGTATNNDGANKQGYTTPSVSFQRDVVLEASGVADIDLESVGMIEAHGTGTLIGDPIEVAALTEAFREYTDKVQYCAIGSVKGNIGHLDAAAGIASIIKAALCVNKGILVPSINFSEANPSLQLSTSPFYVSQKTSVWPQHFELRRAGVSSLGVGGSNVHVLVEEPPMIDVEEETKRPFVVALSSLNQQNLQSQKKQLSEYVLANPTLTLADLEFSSLYGRKVMPYRFSVVCTDKDELVAQLNGIQNDNCFEGFGNIPETVFMFPGQGSQYANMALALYENNEAFKKDMNYCFDYLKTISQVDFKETIFSDDSVLLDKTENTQIGLFIVEYCLTKELMRAGIKPDAIIGHSLGEYTAACIVGSLTLEDALKLVYHRGRLMGMMPKGAMLLVQSTENDLKPLLLNGVSFCAFNADNSVVIGGSIEDIGEQCSILELNSIEYKKLKVSHAYHTQMMNDVLAEYDEILSQAEFKSFESVIFSTYTGDLVEPEVFCSKLYWLNQIIHPVKFSQAIKKAASHFSNPVFIEIGPGNGLSYFANTIFNHQVSTVSLLPRPSNKSNAVTNFYEAKAILLAKGVRFNLPEVHEGKRVPIPGYVFSKDRFWKPKIKINYKSFYDVKESYYKTNNQYKSDRLRSSIEIELAHDKEVSEELLNSLNDLNAQYLNEVKKLFSTTEKISNLIEVLYDEVVLDSEEITPSSIQFNKKRNVNSVFVAPETETEKSIQEYWSTILGYSPAGIQDNYFEVGGNSLLATKLLSLLSDKFEITLSFRELSECQTIKELAVLIDSKKEILELVETIEMDNNNDNYIEL